MKISDWLKEMAAAGFTGKFTANTFDNAKKITGQLIQDGEKVIVKVDK
jgi:hypothetical protein